MRLLILFYSAYGHIFTLAEAAARAAAENPDHEVLLRQVPETLPTELQEKLGITETKKAFAHVPTASLNDMVSADAILFGTPTRFGGMCAQMRQFLDATGSLWAKGSLVGKAAGVFTSSATQHGGQESTILSFHTFLLHQGMVIVGLPYTFTGQTTLAEISGCSPYGASTIAGPEGERQPSENEIAGIQAQTRHLTAIAAKLTPQL